MGHIQNMYVVPLRAPLVKILEHAAALHGDFFHSLAKTDHKEDRVLKPA